MKKLPSFAAFLCLLNATASFAGSVVTYKNEALGFRLNVAPMSDDISICDSQDNCLEFKPIGQKGNKSFFREATGKCELSLENFSKDFREGITKNDFMLSLGLQIVQVYKGEDACKLQQELPSQKRSLTGLYE